MDDEILTQVIVDTIQRSTKKFQDYEIAIANLSIEVLRLKKKVDELMVELNDGYT